MTMYKQKSADVLNGADRFERILDWQLFQMDQERILYWTTDDSDWVPGDPLFEDPRDLIHDAFDEEAEGYVGNCVRPMYQVLPDHPLPPHCIDCNVRWGNEETRCWICGAEERKTHNNYALAAGVPGYSVNRFNVSIFDETRLFATQLSEAIAEITLSMTQSMREFNQQFSVVFNDVFNDVFGFVSQIDQSTVNPFVREIPERIVTASVSESAADPLDRDPSAPMDAVWRRSLSLRVDLPHMTPEQLGPQQPIIAIPVVNSAQQFTHPQTTPPPGTTPVTERRRTRL